MKDNAETECKGHSNKESPVSPTRQWAAMRGFVIHFGVKFAAVRRLLNNFCQQSFRHNDT